MSEITRERAQAFLDELAAVCQQHGLSLAHEDEHGAFLVRAYDPAYTKWLRDARLVDPHDPAMPDGLQ